MWRDFAAMSHTIISSAHRIALALLCIGGFFLFAGCHTAERTVDATEHVGRKAVHATGHVIHRTGEGVERVGHRVEHSVE